MADDSPKWPGAPEVEVEEGAAEEAAPEPVGTADVAATAEAAEPIAPEDAAVQAPDYLAIAQRTQADFDNFRRRATRDVQAAEARGTTKVVRELLPALDNLERAIAAAEAEEGDQEHHLTKGIRLVQSELAAALERVGIEAFSPKGEPFDPTEHEAMAQQPVEGVESGIVAEVYQPGYRLKGAIVRPARVVVAA